MHLHFRRVSQAIQVTAFIVRSNHRTEHPGRHPPHGSSFVSPAALCNHTPVTIDVMTSLWWTAVPTNPGWLVCDYTAQREKQSWTERWTPLWMLVSLIEWCKLLCTLPDLLCSNVSAHFIFFCLLILNQTELCYGPLFVSFHTWERISNEDWIGFNPCCDLSYNTTLITQRCLVRVLLAHCTSGGGFKDIAGLSLVGISKSSHGTSCLGLFFLP